MSMDLFYRGLSALRRRIGLDTAFDDPFAHTDKVEDREEVTGTELGRLFISSTGRPVHKWIHYFPVYERYFARYRGTDFKMLEIGVALGGSLELWRRYFGDKATLFGIDIDPACAERFDPPNQVRIGSQDDPAFLKKVVAEMGSLDVVLDDGSHIARHQQASFEILFPLLKDGGIYMIEDVHTAYWAREYGGGFRRPGTAIELGKDWVDDLHHWYHGRRALSPARGQIRAVHFHDSIVVIEKKADRPPVQVQVGGPAASVTPARR